MHENKMHDVSAFITLTYDDDHLPEGGSLVKRDFQLFMKRLRKARDEKVRFYACGEYGEKSGRPHYHALIFGTGFPDMRLRRKSRSGEMEYFDSGELRSLWPAGNNIIGAVTFESAAYVARYIMKKITGDLAEEHYQGREPEFTLMSRRPGIGADWLAKYGKEVYRDDSVIVRGVECLPPRFYDDRYYLVDSKRIDVLKKVRRGRSVGKSFERRPERRRVKEKVCEAKLKLGQREL